MSCMLAYLTNEGFDFDMTKVENPAFVNLFKELQPSKNVPSREKKTTDTHNQFKETTIVCVAKAGTEDGWLIVSVIKLLK